MSIIFAPATTIQDIFLLYKVQKTSQSDCNERTPHSQRRRKANIALSLFSIPLLQQHEKKWGGHQQKSTTSTKIIC